MPSPVPLHDLACIVHVHSTHSDGTGTVAQIAAAGRRAGVDVVLLTDHDSLEARRRGEERWYGSTLVLVGEEVSPKGKNHLLAFGVDHEVSHRGLSPGEICAAVQARGGFGFLAHPFSRGSERFSRPGMPWGDLDCEGYTGIELWSFVTDSAERIRNLAEALLFVALPGRFVDHPPRRNVEEWDRLCRARRVVALGGLDAHQMGIRVRGRVPLRLMGYARSFRRLRTHVLCEEPLAGSVERDREEVYSALRHGRCYLAMDSLAAARGFSFWAEGPEGTLSMGAEAPAGAWTLHASLPRVADVRLIRDGRQVAAVRGAALEHRAEGPGVFRLEATLRSAGRDRTWILSNPIYLR